MNCENIKPLLSRSIDGQLDRAEQVMVAAHLKACPQCTAYYKKLLGINQAAQNIIPDGNPDYWTAQKDKIIDRINQLEKTKIVPIAPKKSYGYIFKWTAVAASVAIVAFISIHEYRAAHPGAGILSPKTKLAPALQGIQKEPVITMPVDSAEGAPSEKSKPALALKMEQKEEVGIAKIIAPTVAKTERPAEKDNLAAVQTPEIVDYQEVPPAVKPVPEESEEATSSQSKKNETVPKQIVPSVALLKEETPLTTALQNGKGANKYTAARSLEAEGKADLSKTVSIDAISGEDNLETYAEWRRRLEYLEARHGNILNGHTYESAAKSRIGETSLRSTIAGFADAYYNIARLTPMPTERAEMIARLQTLLRRSDAVMAILIKNYLGFLWTSN